MAIGRGSMTKELIGNRVKKKAMGGMAGAAGAGDLAGRARGQAISAMAQQGARPPMGAAPTLPVGVTTPPMPSGGGLRSPMAMKAGGAAGMKKGGSVRGCGCAKRGTKGAKMV